MRATGLLQYKIGAKNNWRRWAWNRILDGLQEIKVRPSEARIIYLPGPNDLDRPIAISKGFKHDNIIPINDNPPIVKALRRSGWLAICARLEEIIEYWPADWPVHGIIADFCAGMERSTIDCLLNIYQSCGIVVGARIVANLQRGRDYSYERGKEVLASVDEMYQFTRTWFPDHFPENEKPTNRVYHMLIYLIHNHHHDQRKPLTRFFGPMLAQKMAEKAMDKLREEMTCEVKSYRSSKVIMDSMALRYPESWAPEAYFCYRDYTPEEQRLMKRARRLVAAYRALRTRRQALLPVAVG